MTDGTGGAGAAGGAESGGAGGAGTGGAGAAAIAGAGGSGTGAGGASWRDALPEAMRGEAALANFNDVGALAQGFLETKRALSGKTAPDFTSEQGLKSFADAVRPADAAAYDIPAFDEGGKAMADAFRGFAHQTGLPPAWANATAKWFNEQMGAAISAENTRSQSEVDQLKGKMGAAVFDQKLAAVQRMLPAFGVQLAEGDLARLDAKLGSGNLLTLMFAIADRVGEPATIENGAGDGLQTALTPQAAQQLWQEKNKDADWRKKAVQEGTPENREYKRINAAIAQGRARANAGMGQRPAA